VTEAPRLAIIMHDAVDPTGISPDQIIGRDDWQLERPLRATTSYYAMGDDNTMIEQSNYDRVLAAVAGFRLLGRQRGLIARTALVERAPSVSPNAALAPESRMRRRQVAHRVTLAIPST
jgi:hypothetical protein